MVTSNRNFKQITQTVLTEQKPNPPLCYQTTRFNPKSQSCETCTFIKGCATWNFWESLRKVQKIPIKKIILESPITWMIIGGFTTMGIITTLTLLAEWIF